LLNNMGEDIKMIKTILLLYLFIGVLLTLIGPGKKSLAKAVNELNPTPSQRLRDDYKEPTKTKIYLFKTILTLGIVAFWPALLPGILKENTPPKSEIEEETIYESDDDEIGFLMMGGHGVITCKDCNYKKELTSFTHGGKHSTSGYQCQACSKLSTRSRTQPFDHIHINDNQSLLDFTPKQRARTIEHMIGMAAMCERYMRETPKKKWLQTWEPTATEYRKKLSQITVKEIEAIKKKRKSFEIKYKASLTCSCGGELSRDKTIICPKCKSKKLKYDMEYIT
jgi:hypothetical protein